MSLSPFSIGKGKEINNADDPFLPPHEDGDRTILGNGTGFLA
jgi:hypothetical protein